VNKVQKFIDNVAEITALGFGLNRTFDKNSDEYIDYFG
jgi:hypothetical protein